MCVCVCVCVCGGGGGGGVKQSDSDFNERGNNLSRGRKWAQHQNLLKCEESMSPVTQKRHLVLPVKLVM